MATDSDLNALISSLSCWETAGYAGLVVVLIGVIGEGVHDFTQWFKRTWWGPHGGRLSVLVLIIGLAAEGVAQVNANSRSGKIIAFLGEQEATTRERAAKLEIQLATITKSRRLSREAQSRVTASLKPFAGASFDLSSSGDTDSVNLALDIRHALLDAGLVEKFSQSRMVINPPDGSQRIALIIRSGIVIGLCYPVGTQIAGNSAAAVLLTQLNNEIPGAGERPVELGTSTDCSEPDIIHVAVGSRLP